MGMQDPYVESLPNLIRQYSDGSQQAGLDGLHSVFQMAAPEVKYVVQLAEAAHRARLLAPRQILQLSVHLDGIARSVKQAVFGEQQAESRSWERSSAKTAMKEEKLYQR